MLKIHELNVRSIDEHLVEVSFSAEPGEVLAIIGPDLSGKHLLGQAIAGEIISQSGLISINHYHLSSQPIKARRQVGYLAGPFRLTPSLTAFEYLDLVGSIYRLTPKERISRINELITKLDFNQQAYSPLEQVSQSTQQKVGLAAALIHQPSILVLDEPMQFLDFAGQMRLTKLIQLARQDNVTVILITNNLTLAENWADQFVLLDDGQIIASGTLKQLLNQSKPAVHNLQGVYAAIYDQ